MKTKFSFLLTSLIFLITSPQAATWQKITSEIPTYQVCPDGYVFVPALSGYTTRDFCVAKYEMKNDGYGTAVSQAAGTPWVSINRATARSKCQALGAGFDMISNDQWQTLARNIAGTASNWSGGAVASGALNFGHTDQNPLNALAAAADSDPCNGTGQTCSATTWDSQRRTNTLSNGNVIWDVGGNVQEWVTDDSNYASLTTGYISTFSTGDIRQTRYGAAAGTFCASPSTGSRCGMGYAIFSTQNTTVVRGGMWNHANMGGVFYVDFASDPTTTTNSTGFRCVFIP